MVKYMNDILKKSEELIEVIKDSCEYNKYIELKSKMIQDEDIMRLINNVKCIQKEIVKRKSENKDISMLEKNIEKSLNKLNDIPLYVEYELVQQELNRLLQQIKNTIESCINDITK